MTQTLPITEYDPAILARAPREHRRELDHSAAVDKHRGHSVLSLAVQLGVWPWLVHDVLRVMERVMRAEHLAAQGERGEPADEWQAAIDAEADVWGKPRYQGGYEIPDTHAEFDGTSWLGDRYLTADAVAFVLDSIRPAAVTGEAAAHGVSYR